MSFSSASMAMFGLFSTNSCAPKRLSVSRPASSRCAAPGGAHRKSTRGQATVKHKLGIGFKLSQNLSRQHHPSDPSLTASGERCANLAPVVVAPEPAAPEMLVTSPPCEAERSVNNSNPTTQSRSRHLSAATRVVSAHMLPSHTSWCMGLGCSHGSCERGVRGHFCKQAATRLLLTSLSRSGMTGGFRRMNGGSKSAADARARHRHVGSTRRPNQTQAHLRTARRDTTAAGSPGLAHAHALVRPTSCGCQAV